MRPATTLTPLSKNDNPLDGLAVANAWVATLEAALLGVPSAPPTKVQMLLASAGRLKGEALHVCIEALLSLCQRLYVAGRSIEAIPLAQAAGDWAETLPDLALRRRAATAHGIVLAQVGDYTQAILWHTRSLRLAELLADPEAIAGAWSNLGLALLYAGAYDAAAEVYSHAIAALRAMPAGTHNLYVAYANLTQCHVHLADSAAAYSAGQKALALETPDILRQSPTNAIILRRNMVRVLLGWPGAKVAMALSPKVRARNRARAKLLVDEARHLAQPLQSPIATIAASVAEAMYEVATGQADVGLTRLRQVLGEARHYVAPLRDTLTCLVQAEAMAGHPDRAAYYLNELADSVYREAAAKTREHLGLPAAQEDDDCSTLSVIEARRREFAAEVTAPSADDTAETADAWQALERMAQLATFRFDSQGEHSHRVQSLAYLLALEAGYSATQAYEISYAARFHDVGVMMLPEAIWGKHSALSAVELAVMRSHCHAGAILLAASLNVEAMLAVDIARYHHEWWNGQGYPDGIAGEAIPRPARLCAIVDAYDALTSTRPYRAAFSPTEALALLQEGAGRQFDPHLVECFLASAAQGRIATYLQASRAAL
ncbi:MAG: HD domain-containing protein [Betaproteobacteria bacterium]|nr:HD domain-containing protein [Betaproteobacteria bacterium]